MHKQKTSGFTLVELIVVITILVILGTIAFISLQGYSAQSRDSVRITDLSSIKSGLELYNLDAGKYPSPNDETVITYSGAVAWTQGTFGEQAKKNIDKLDKVPTDPLTDKKYVYSTNSTRYEFQLAGAMEGDEVSYSPRPWGEGLGVRDTSAASTKTAKLKITGNYNGKLLKVTTGSTDFVLALPSIMAMSGTTVESITANNYLAYNGYKNLPFQYDGAYKTDGETALSLVSTTNYVVFSGSLSTLSDTTSTGINARKVLIDKLQLAYSGTSITAIGEIAQILTTNTSDPIATEYVSTNLVANNLGGTIVASTSSSSSSSSSSTSSSSGGGSSCNSTQPSNATVTTGSPSTSNQAWQNTNSANPCYFTCSAGYGWNGSSCVTATDCGVSGLTEITLANGQTWSCMNLGATTVWNGSTAPTNCGSSSTNCNSALTWLGNYYQWGRNEAVTGSFITNTYNGSLTNGAVGSNDMYKGDTTYGDWWQNEVGSTTPTRWTGTNPQGPCATGWHVPSSTEWGAMCNSILGTTCTNSMTYNALISTKLRIPFAGYRTNSSGAYAAQNTYGTYWTSTPTTTRSYYFTFGNSMISPFGTDLRSYGFSVRCLKN